MEDRYIYSDKKESIKLIIFGIAMIAAAIMVSMCKHRIKVESSVIIAVIFVMVINLIGIVKYHKKSSKMMRYVNLKNKIIIHIVITLTMLIILAFVPWGFTLVGVFGAIYFGIIVSWKIYHIISNRAEFVLMKDGFIDNSTLLGGYEVKYSEIKDMFIYGNNTNRQLIIVIDEMDKKLKGLNKIKRLLNIGKKYIEIPDSTMELQIEDLEELIRERMKEKSLSE